VGVELELEAGVARGKLVAVEAEEAVGTRKASEAEVAVEAEDMAKVAERTLAAVGGRRGLS
jgi:hypothetical protein